MGLVAARRRVEARSEVLYALGSINTRSCTYERRMHFHSVSATRCRNTSERTNCALKYGGATSTLDKAQC